jgi:glycosyltransferase involved in cell wall biosynthesis
MPDLLTTSTIIPVINEVHGLRYLLPQLVRIKEIDQILVIDDGSVDGTQDFVSLLAAADPRIVLLSREQRGLGSAVRYGARQCISNYAIVMDGDGQHRIEDFLAMLTRCRANMQENPVVIGSRFLQDSKISGFPTRRLMLSRLLTAGLRLTIRNSTSDPLSGFFAAPVDLLVKTKTNGFKILYDLLLQSPDNPTVDIPISFSRRVGGVSKAQIVELYRLIRIIVTFYCSPQSRR